MHTIKHTSPSVRENAFNCPYCGALAKQFWLTVHCEPKEKNGKPHIVAVEEIPDFSEFPDIEPDQKDKFISHYKKLASKQPFLDQGRKNVDYYLHNVSASRCYNCDEIAIWIYDRMVCPTKGDAPAANPDLPKEIVADYNEASAILDKSPRGSAALIRLCIQKLCIHLGEKGKNINDDIASLVSQGLSARIQMALDAIRVTGNNAVHPGQIDLKDDRAAAESLFGLLNIIAEKMISEPKHIQQVYDKLPESAREQIDKRDNT